MANIIKLKVEEFFYHIILWEYEWMFLVEQLELKSQLVLRTFNSLNGSFLIDKQFKSYDDYYKTMLQMQLLETFEEATTCFREQCNSGARSYHNSPIWYVKSIKHPLKNKTESVFQSNF